MQLVSAHCLLPHTHLVSISLSLLSSSPTDLIFLSSFLAHSLYTYCSPCCICSSLWSAHGGPHLLHALGLKSHVFFTKQTLVKVYLLPCTSLSFNSFRLSLSEMIFVYLFIFLFYYRLWISGGQNLVLQLLHCVPRTKHNAYDIVHDHY